VKVAQSQLRHTTPKITLELYAQAVSADQQEAHRKVVQMMLPTRFPEQLKERIDAATLQLRKKRAFSSAGCPGVPETNPAES
jgi:hypothetical protein